MRTNDLVAVLGAIALAGSAWMGVAEAGKDPVLKCAATKQKAAGKAAAKKLGCHAKAASKGEPLDPACLGKVAEKFAGAFAKADAKGGCAGGAGAVEDAVDTCVNGVAGQIPDTGKCPKGKLKVAGKRAAAKLGCHAKATGKSVPVDPACLAKVEAGYDAKFAKAGTCAGDPGGIAATIDTGCVAGVLALVPSGSGPACGDGNVDEGETCDDGNTVHGDACPSDCVIESCTPLSGSSRLVDVHFAPPGGASVAGLTVLVDYPEGKVSIPGSGSGAAGRISNTPSGAFVTTNDLDHVMREVVASASPIAPGRLFTIDFENCDGALAPAPGDFTCTVEDAADEFGSTVSGVTCSVVLP